MATRSAIINVMAKACYKVSRRMVRDFGEVEHLQVSRKGPADFVSTADLAAEKQIVAELSHARPEYGFLLEEGKAIESRDPKGRRWIVDPLDGTTNFLHGVPHWAISIGLEEDCDLVAGVVYDPIGDELFWAEKGYGAYLNDRRIRVSDRNNIADCLIATGAPFKSHGDHDLYLDQLREVIAATSGVRRLGVASLDLAYVATGRCDGFWEHGLQPWDIAAGVVLIREAGGYVTDFRGREGVMDSGDVVAANARMHHRLLKLVRPAKPSKS